MIMPTTRVTTVAPSAGAVEALRFRTSLREEAKRLGFEVVAHLEGAADLVETVERTNSTGVLVSSIATLGAEIGTSLLGLLARGIEVYSVAEPWLAMQTAGERNLITHLLAWQADHAEEERGRRIREGQRKAMARGAKVGRPRKVVDIERALALLDAGTTIADAARALGCSRTHLKRALDAQSVLSPSPQPAPSPWHQPALGPLAKRILEIAGDPSVSAVTTHSR